MSDEKASFANGSCCPARNSANSKSEGLLFCGNCEDAMTPVIRPGRSVKIIGLFCLTCLERVDVRRGRIKQATVDPSAPANNGRAA
jgi:hypothetical protein